VPSRIEYLNTEEVAISSIAFPGKISQSLSNVSFFFVLMMEKKYLNQRRSVSQIVVTLCNKNVFNRSKFESLL